MFYLILALSGALTGVTTVLFGFGGGFVIVPLLYHMLSASQDAATTYSAMHVAVATSTAVMILNAVLATRKQARAGNLLRAYLWPWAGFIAAGAIIGACVAIATSSDLVRFAFIAYLAVTIADCLGRRGFLSRRGADEPRLLSRVDTVAGGITIGVIATFLGVGGSVMTVPLLRRRGLSMAQATAMANPLSLPVALAGTASYVVLGWLRPIHADTWQLGYINVPAFLLLACGSFAGVQLASRFLGRVPDRVHARIYVGLLVVVMSSMLVK
jgi:uncharacterized membrane protein YfcA